MVSVNRQTEMEEGNACGVNSGDPTTARNTEAGLSSEKTNLVRITESE